MNNRLRTRIGPPLLASVLVVSVAHLFADQVVFKSGKVAEGVIIEEAADQVVLRERGGTVVTYDKSLIQAIKRDSSPLGYSPAELLARLSGMREAGHYDEAIRTIFEAVDRAPAMASVLAESFKATLFQLERAAREASSTNLPRARELYRLRYDTLRTTFPLALGCTREAVDEWLRSTGATLAELDYRLAVSLASQPEKLHEIRQLLEEAVALDPRSAHAWLYLGNVALAAGDLQAASRAYRTVLSFSSLAEDTKRAAEAGLQRVQTSAPIAPVATVRAGAVPGPPPPKVGREGEISQPAVQEPTSWFDRLRRTVEQRAEATGLMTYLRPVWSELSSGQYTAYLVGVSVFVIVFWLVPQWFLGMRSRRGDFAAAELREKVRLLGIFSLVLYCWKLAKTSQPKNRCPFCNKSLDKIDAYTDLNFVACPHCHEPITPIYDLKDYIDHLMKQLELQFKHAKENAVATGVERDLMLRLVRAVVTLAVRRRASDLHLESEVDGAKLRVRVDGMMYDFLKMPRTVALAFISALKIMANLDITERRIPQDGKIAMWIDKADLDLRLNTSPAAMGEKVTIRILNQKAIAVDPAKLGLEGENLERFERAIHRPHGMIIVTGPAGSGKSTTLYVALNLLNTGEKNIVTLEDPIEYQIKGASQMQVNPATNFTFATGLRSILRQDPDIIMVGEIRDSETAQIAVEAALTGHLLLTTLHTIDSPTAFARMADLGVDTSRMASALICILAQRLVRTICPECKKPYKPKREVLEQLNIVELPRDFTFIHGAGCEQCMNTGYWGRIGLFEFLMPDEQMREILEGAPPVSVIRELARKKGFSTLREEGLRRVYQGLTTVEEVLRATT